MVIVPIGLQIDGTDGTFRRQWIPLERLKILGVDEGQISGI